MELLKIQGVEKLLILAILIRLLIMPFYFHPDIKTYNFQASFLKNGVFNIYTHLDQNRDKLPLKEEFVYFPLTYFFLGTYQILASPLFGQGFQGWLSDATFQFRETIGVYKYLFLLKLPYLFFDISIALLLTKFVSDSKEKKKLFTLWLFNPLSLILIYVYSNVDIIPVFLTLLSLHFAMKNKLILSAFIIGLAAGFKAYPLIFIPLLLLYAGNIKRLFLILLVSFGTFFLIVLPFLSLAFQKAALVSGLTTRIVSYGLSIGFEQVLIPFIICFSAILFFQVLNENKQTKNLLYCYIAVLLLIYSFVHFHIQWLLWIVPFIILLSLSQPKISKLVVFLMATAFTIPLLLNDGFMSVSLLMAYSLHYSLLPTPFTLVQRFYDPYILQSILHSIFVGGSLMIVFKLFKREE